MYFDLCRNYLFFNIVIKLYYFYLFDNFFKINKFNRNCFYIHENQPWEKSLIYHWKKNNKGNIFGVVSSSVRFWDIRYKKTIYNSDILLANGQDSFDKLLNFGYKNYEVRKVETLRYDQNLYVEKTKFLQKKEILVLLDYSKKSNELLTNILNKSELIKDYDLIIKEHPLRKYENKKLNYMFYKDIEKNHKKIFDLVICTNKTTASVDYYLDSQRIAILIEPDFFNFSPLKGNIHCDFFYDNIGLDQILKKTTNGVKKIILIQNFFWLTQNLTNGKKFLIMKNNYCYLITGASKGIGRSFLELLVKKKLFAIVLVRNAKEVSNFKNNSNIKIFQGDITDDKIIIKIFDYIKKKKINVKYLINNAGQRQRKSFLKISKKNIREIFDVNFFRFLI